MLEQHPVPQNVTNFQFRLIGDMTLKQFGYLAGGAILAYVAYNLPLPFFFTYPLAGLFALGGIGFAFVPVEERPMDVWFLSFIKSIYSPTQYLWQREATTEQQPATPSRLTTTPLQLQQNGSLLLQNLSQRIGALLPTPPARNRPATANTSASAPHTVSVAPKQKTASPILPTIQNPFVSLFHKKTGQKAQHTPTPPIPATPVVTINKRVEPIQKPQPAFVTAQTALLSTPIPSVEGQHIAIPQSTPSAPPITKQTPPAVPENTTQQQTQQPQQPSNIEKRLKELEEQLEKEQKEKQRVAEIQQQLVSALNDKQKLEQQLQLLQQQLQQKQQPQPIKQAPIVMPTTKSETVKVISPQAAVIAGMPSLSKVPNVVSGIVREPNGNLLVGILVTVKDKEDIPVRALKTNKLGQFAASTPLTNGTYTIEAEDPRKTLLFDLIKVTLTGGVVPPVEIIAKTQQQLERQKLEQALFGNKAAA